MIRVFLADDHTLFREGLKQIFSDTKDIVVKGEGSSGQEVINKIEQQNYDVVILDISMPDMNGLEILKQVKTKKPETAILILSMYAEDQYAVRAFRAGAAGYLTKAQAPNELLDAIRKIAVGGKYISEDAAEKLVTSLDPTIVTPDFQKLSDREYQIMLMIASGKTVREIAVELVLSGSTVSTLRARLLKKMNFKNNSEITHYVMQEKLID
jgi:DNA-binding NarL/FixJ family response regulator